MSYKGESITNMTQKVAETLQPGVYTAPTSNAGAQGGANAFAFQRAFDARSPMDDTMRLRMGMSDGQGNTPFGQLTVGDKELRWLKKKADITEIANFDQWFGKNFNTADLAGRSFAQSVYPEYYAEREKFMRERTEMALKVKLIQLRGPKSQEDLQLWYLINTGRVALPDDWDRIGPSLAPGAGLNQAQQAQNLARRMVRPPKFVGDNRRYANASTPAGRANGASRANAQDGIGGPGGIGAFPGASVFGVRSPDSVPAEFFQSMLNNQ